MDDNQLLRYSRQIMLPQLDYAGQQKLLEATVLVVGLGGLGSPVAMYLAAAGVGRLILADFDHVDLSNLQRQIAHGQADIGRPKVESAADTLRALNPDVQLSCIDAPLQDESLDQAVAQADVVLDCSDNFATRFALNEACVRHQVPLVSGAAIRMEGQVSVYDPRRDDSPCYRCLYKQDQNIEETCSQSGVLAPVVGLVGSLQAVEAIKLLAGMGTPLVGKLMLIDALSMDIRQMKLRRDPACPVCGHRPTAGESPA